MSTSGPEYQLGDWRRVADGVHVLVAPPAAVNIGLVVGLRRALLVDAGRSAPQGRAVADAMRAVTDHPLAAVVLTHGHPEHAAGRAGFADAGVIAHEAVLDRWPGSDPRRAGQDRGIAVATALDLGERRVEIVHLGRGHSDGDLLVAVPDVHMVFAGDLLDSLSGPRFGPDSFPHEWAATLDGLIGLMTAASRVVPGHGPEVDREYVFEARGRVAAVSGEITRLAGLKVPAAEAAERGQWAYPFERVAGGLASGYAQALPGAAGRRLPLV